MATLRQYFDTDFQVLSAQQEWPLTSEGQRVQVIARAHYDFNAGAKFVSFYLPAVDNTFKVCSLMLSKVPVLFANIEGSLEVQMGWIGSDELEQAKDLAFSGRVFIYSEVDLKGSDLSNLEALATASAMSVRLRGKAMLLARASDNRPQAFISHDFGDKEVVARPLTIALSKLRCPVWYDEFSLKIGDSLRESIEKGLRECGKCVLILSPHFLRNKGWTRVEFNAVFTRELIEEKRFILPVWHEVSKKEVFDYSPSLADRFAAIWDGKPDDTARKLCQSINDIGGTH